MLSALLWSGSITGPIDVGHALQHVDTLWAGEAALILFITVLISLVFHPLQFPLVQLLEGYWPQGWLEHVVGDRRREKFRNHRTVLMEETHAHIYPPSEEDLIRMAEAHWTLRYRYPDQERILPTELGNVLRAAEDRAGQRYGLETVIVWPRLYLLIPERLSRILAQQRNQLDFSARLCVVLLITSLAYLAVILFVPFGWPLRWIWLWVPATTLALAWFSYRGAVSAAMSYGISIETAFDYHRFDMLASLHRPLPVNHEEEVRQNGELSVFLRQGDRMKVSYQHPEAARVPSGRVHSKAGRRRRKTGQKRKQKRQRA